MLVYFVGIGQSPKMLHTLLFIMSMFHNVGSINLLDGVTEKAYVNILTLLCIRIAVYTLQNIHQGLQLVLFYIAIFIFVKYVKTKLWQKVETVFVVLANMFLS